MKTLFIWCCLLAGVCVHVGGGLVGLGIALEWASGVWF